MYFPLLGFARVSWMIQGVQSAFGLEGGAWSTKNEAVAGGRKQGYPLGERVALTLHYVWYFGMAGCVGKAAFGASGLLLAIAQVLTLSHSHTLTLSHSHTLTLTLSHSHTLTLSHSHTLTLSQSHTLTLSHFRKPSMSNQKWSVNPTTSNQKRTIYPVSAIN